MVAVGCVFATFDPADCKYAFENCNLTIHEISLYFQSYGDCVRFGERGGNCPTRVAYQYGSNG
jgi:hypothetical protein